MLPRDAREIDSTWHLDGGDQAPVARKSASWQLWSSEEIDTVLRRFESVRSISSPDRVLVMRGVHYPRNSISSLPLLMTHDDDDDDDC